MKRILAIIFLVIFFVPMAHGQMSSVLQQNTAATNQQSTGFPKIAYTADKSYEVDLTWEPHKILTDQKTIFIFQFYDYQTGGLVPMVDYQFVVSQGGKELVRIPGTTSQAGDYKYYAFANPGPVTISLDKIGDTRASVSFDTTAYQNPNSTGLVTVVQPPPNISNKEKSIFPIIEDVIVGALIALVVWLARDPILRRLRVL